ncbi:hypothetical protein Dimus_028526 [Dionaea muscipula]
MLLTTAAGQAAGSLVQPAADAGKGLYGYLKQKYDNAKNLHKNYDKLLEEEGFLICREDDVNGKIRGEQATMEPTHECVCWLILVREKNVKVVQVKARYEKERSSSCGFFHLFRRSKLSEDILEMTRSVVSLRDKMNLGNDILVRKKPVPVQNMSANEMAAVPSVAEHVNRLVKFIRDEKLHRIGIFGMPGVGKTTIMKNLNDKVNEEEDHMFDIVIWVTVSKDGDIIEQIQKAILERLNLADKVIGRTRHDKECLISDVLGKMKYLLLVDEVYSVIDLDRLGIRKSRDHGIVVLTTREKLICNEMDADEYYEVKGLSKKDAWKLFRDTVGEKVDYPPLKPTANLILELCGGLPQVIKAVGRHLKDDVSEGFFSSTLRKLQSPKSEPLRPMKEIFEAFRLLYDGLTTDQVKHGLLYSASFPGDHEIYQDYLIECWKAEQLISDAETWREARDSGQDMVVQLIDKYMFYLGKSNKYVKMPIIFRNAALRMAASHPVLELLVSNADEEEEEVEDYLSAGKWENARVISLVHTHIQNQNLPENPVCPKLSTLFLQNNQTLTTIPGSFFNCVPRLKVLDLYGTGIQSLPASISKLSSLRALYLNGCDKLVSLPEEIKHLKDLEVLDICGTGMHHCLPTVVGELTRLRCLRASFRAFVGNGGNHFHEALPDDDVALSKLSLLEELSIVVDPKESSWNAFAPKIAAGMAKLKKLTGISFYFPSTECLETFWNSTPERKLRSFKLLVGSYEMDPTHEVNIPELVAPRHLRYSAGVGTPEVITKVLKQACAFELIAHRNTISLSEFGIQEMQSLEFCSLQECIEMKSIVGSNVSDAAFQWLKELRLRGLQELSSICDGAVVSGSFSKLTTLTFYECPSMVKVLSFEITKQLIQLHRLRVEACPGVTDIIEAEVPPSVGTLPRLEILELVNLNGLLRIYPDGSFKWPSLQKIEMNGCDKLSGLPLGIENAPRLQFIRCRGAWWSKTASLDNKTNLEKYCHFI